MKIHPYDPKEMKTDAYMANFEEAISTYFKGGNTTSHVMKHLSLCPVSTQEKSAMGCQRLVGSLEVSIKLLRCSRQVAH